MFKWLKCLIICSFNVQLLRTNGSSHRAQIKQTCSDAYDREVDGSEQGVVVECLKNALSQGLLKDRGCRLEVVALIEESEVDIQFDPILYRTCDIDLRKYCADTERGTGRRKYSDVSSWIFKQSGSFPTIMLPNLTNRDVTETLLDLTSVISR